MRTIKRLAGSLSLLCLLPAACTIEATPPPPTAEQITETAAAPTEPPRPTIAPTLPPTATPPIAPTATVAPTATKPAAPTQTPLPQTSNFAPAVTNLEGFDDGLLLVTFDDALVLFHPGRGEVVTLLEPGMYDMGDDGDLIPLIWPVRFSPDGRRLLVPTPDDGTWLIGPDGAKNKFHSLRLFATWSPDGQRITYVGQSGQFGNPTYGDVFVADPAAKPPTEPLASLTGGAGSAVWSPGCAEPATPDQACGRYVAVGSTIKDGLALWLLDADSGEKRELGRFRPPPMGGTLWHRWTADGRAVLAHADMVSLAFPLDGSGPRQLVVEAAPPPTVSGQPSPTGTLYARLERDREGVSTLFIGDSDTDREVQVSRPFSQGEGMFWSGDGRYLLVANYSGATGGYEVWAIDTAGFPQPAEPFLLAEAAALLGPVSWLRERSTEVEPLPWATVEALAAAGTPDTWERHDMPDAGIRFAAPAGWRVQVDEWYFTAANYAPLTGGIVALDDEQIRIDGRWSGDHNNSHDYTDLAAMQAFHFNWDVSPIEVNGIAGVVLRDRIAPLCDYVLLPHRGGEIEIALCPTTDEQRQVMSDFLAGLELLPED